MNDFKVLIVIASCTTGLELDVHSLACIRNNAGHGLHAIRYSKFVGSRIPYYTNSNATFQVELLLAGDVHPNPGPHLTHVPTHAFVNLSSHTAERISYETSYLLKCDLGPWKTSCQSLHPDVLNRIYALGISRTPGPRCIKLTINGKLDFNDNYHRILDADWSLCLVFMVVTIENKVTINGKFYATGPRTQEIQSEDSSRETWGTQKTASSFVNTWREPRKPDLYQYYQRTQI